MNTKGEQYGPGWAYIALMVHENGEIHAVGGDRRGDDPDADLPYIGLERIDALLSSKGKTHITLSEHKQVTQPPEVSSELIRELARMCGLIPAHTTAEWVSALVRFVRVVLDNNSVQEAFVRANAGLLATSAPSDSRSARALLAASPSAPAPAALTDEQIRDIAARFQSHSDDGAGFASFYSTNLERFARALLAAGEKK